MPALKRIRQCIACPWRVAVDPPRDVPNYGEGIYDRMRATLRSGLDSLDGGIAMACHNQKKNETRPCAGWLHNQLGVGNNIAIRIHVSSGKLPVPIVRGEQHETPPEGDV